MKGRFLNEKIGVHDQGFSSFRS